MTDRLGSQIGLIRLATIKKYNDDGTVNIALNQGELPTPADFAAPIPLAWTGQEGEFLGGYPRVGSSVAVSQGHGGKWYIVCFVPSDSVFDNTATATLSSIGRNRMSALRPGRLMGQVKDGTRFFIDPELGFQAGRADNSLHLHSGLNILTHNYQTELAFTNAYRHINGIIKRDLGENSNRNVLGSTLDSAIYDKSLYKIGLDPTSLASPATTGPVVRNPALSENREVFYEFSHLDNFTTDQDEAARYADPNSGKPFLAVSRREMRSDALSLSLAHPNHLIEVIRGTAVDLLGNIVDINRNALPIGKIDAISLKNNTDKVDAFNRIRAQLRKSIAYHLEINTRKGPAVPVPVSLGGTVPDPTALPPPDITTLVDYARDRSRFSVDIDKEGQFKINVPASSETGNIPLLTRAENYSVILASTDTTVDPDAFVKNTAYQDIFLDNFAGKPSVMLSSSDTDLDGYEAPIDRITDQPIKYGTAFHDIKATCTEFTTNASYLQLGLSLVNFDKNNRLNTNWVPLPQVITDTITVSGQSANAGGRSGQINLDGFLAVNIGANTIDRQSLWFDYAGGVVGNIGRDSQGISYACNMDGDLFLQVGGTGIGNTFDSRFATQNDAIRNGTVDIRVICNGQLMIFRMGPEGISLVSPGTLVLSSQQDIVIRSNASIKMDAPVIMMHAESTKRTINKFPANTI
ncbi:MAG TPA: hypothetical protein VM577_08555 [Anaerovoracaceae bacterium]|nr:hypothetical protein [Anaerovoracaceae bacterium]